MRAVLRSCPPGGFAFGLMALLRFSLVLLQAAEPSDLTVPAGYAIEKVAGAPAVQFPMFGALDERGRLFVAESSGLDLYAELQKLSRTCRISVLEDRDGDGRYESARVFIDQLVFPMGLVWHEGRLYVADPPNIVAFEDTDAGAFFGVKVNRKLGAPYRHQRRGRIKFPALNAGDARRINFSQQGTGGEMNPAGIRIRAFTNRFRFRLSPDVFIAARARVKAPGDGMVGDDVELIARQQPGDDMTPYERLLGDAIEGDATLFASADSIEAAWRVVQPVLSGMPPPAVYERGTWGPADANRIIVGDGRWHDPPVDMKEGP